MIQVWSLDLATMQTLKMKSMNKARDCFKATVVEGRVFVIGGRNNSDENAKRTVQKLVYFYHSRNSHLNACKLEKKTRIFFLF